MIYAEQAPMMGQYQMMEYYEDEGLEAAGAGQSIQAAQKEGLDPKAVAEKVMEAARSVIGLEDDSVHMDSPLMETGMDSLSSVQFRNVLMRAFDGMTMPASLMFDYPTVLQITDHVVAQSKQ